MLATAFATIASVSAGKLKGISAAHLSKVWSIPHEDAARTLQVTTHRHCPAILVQTTEP